ncbi:MAG: hypothetical protein ABI644_06695 [Arenimonas sp.]
MKRVLALCLMCVLSSCASTDSAKMAQTKQNSSGYDEQYMAKVERQAAQRGVTVRWINPPRVSKVKKDGR